MKFFLPELVLLPGSAANESEFDDAMAVVLKKTRRYERHLQKHQAIFAEAGVVALVEKHALADMQVQWVELAFASNTTRLCLRANENRYLIVDFHFQDGWKSVYNRTDHPELVREGSQEYVTAYEWDINNQGRIVGRILTWGSEYAFTFERVTFRLVQSSTVPNPESTRKVDWRIAVAV